MTFSSCKYNIRLMMINIHFHYIYIYIYIYTHTHTKDILLPVMTCDDPPSACLRMPDWTSTTAYIRLRRRQSCVSPPSSFRRSRMGACRARETPRRSAPACSSSRAPSTEIYTVAQIGIRHSWSGLFSLFLRFNAASGLFLPDYCMG